MHDGFVISNKNNSNQFEYTVYTIDGKESGKGFAYYNKNIDLTKGRGGTYIFTYKNEKGILQQVRIIFINSDQLFSRYLTDHTDYRFIKFD